MNVISDTVIQDVRIPRAVLANPDFGGTRDGDCQRGTLVLRTGRVAALLPGEPTDAPRILLPKLTEPHCHLDKCHSLHRIADVGGDLMAAIAAQAADKENWTRDDLIARASRGLQECVDAGCQTVRSHIDWGDTSEPPLAWRILPELDSDRMAVQWAALTGIDQMADREFCKGVAGHVAATPGGVLGSFVLTHPLKMIQAGLRNMFAEASQLGLAVDFHVDETLADLNGIELIADTAIEMGHEGPILCGHAVSLMNRNPDEVGRIAEKLARAEITVCALPTTNLYLQSRGATTPEQRGITRMKELMDAGVCVTVGSDNVADAFCPLGQHDPMTALHLACLIGHLDPPLARLLPMITTHAQQALGETPVTVDGSHVDQLLISNAQTTAGLIARQHVLMPISRQLHQPAH